MALPSCQTAGIAFPDAAMMHVDSKHFDFSESEDMVNVFRGIGWSGHRNAKGLECSTWICLLGISLNKNDIKTA